MASLQRSLTLTHALNQVSRDEELLDIVRDCFCFVTTFFEPISVSAIHIYHSALELSPLSSIVRRLYHHRRHTPFPRVVTGIEGSWDQGSMIRHDSVDIYGPFTWSPCGQVFAAGYQGAVGVRDPLTSELLSTLRPTEPVNQPIHALAYSPDGRSIAALLATSLIIWDIQTGGVAKEVEYGDSYLQRGALLVWSLDGRAIAICTTVLGRSNPLKYPLRVYDIDTGATQSCGLVRSYHVLQLWAHNGSFRIMTTMRQDELTLTLDISEVGSVLTKIESFRVGVGFETFSPATYRFADAEDFQLRIFDIRNLDCLLWQEGHFNSCSHCFSSDGSLFAVISGSDLQIWKYGSGHYTAWGTFPTQHDYPSLWFSPDLSSIAGLFPDLLRVWRLDRPAVAHPDRSTPRSLATLSQCGTYLVTGHRGDSTVAITNLPSQTPSQFIDTGIEFIAELALTGNVLLVTGEREIVAWRLTEEGVVDGPPGGRRAGPSDSIWTFTRTDGFGVGSLIVSLGDPTVVIQQPIVGTSIIHAYHAGTGEVLKPTPPPSHSDRRYFLQDLMHGLHHLHRRNLETPNTHSENDWPVSRKNLKEGWVKDPEGGHRLWIPPAWRLLPLEASLHCNITTLWLTYETGTVIVKFQ